MFVRANGLVPQSALDQNAENWTLTIDGEVDKPLELTIDDLKGRFENVTQRLWIECGGNGRAYFQPGASGNQWTVRSEEHTSALQSLMRLPYAVFFLKKKK